MGVFFHLKNGTTKYASIGGNQIVLTRANVMIPRDNYSGYTDEITRFELNSLVHVYNDKDHKKEAGSAPLTTVQVQVISDEYPEGNLYELLYEQYKQTLYSYEDDI